MLGISLWHPLSLSLITMSWFQGRWPARAIEDDGGGGTAVDGGGGIVEEQDLGLGRKRHRNLEAPLLAVREVGDRGVAAI